VLDQLLEYKDEPQADEFVSKVMLGVKRQQRTRKLILWVSGLTGALFGVTGAAMLSDSITRLFTVAMSANSALPVSLAIIGVLAFLAWLLNDDMSLSG
jgi:hypothetical protein